jgi:hypothetical protein
MSAFKGLIGNVLLVPIKINWNGCSTARPGHENENENENEN